MTRKSFLLWLYLLAAFVVHAQPDMPASYSTDEQAKTVWEWYKNLLQTKDSATIIASLQKAEQTYRDQHQELPMQQAWLVQRVYQSTRYRGLPQSVDIMLKAEADARSKGWPMVAAECWYFIGDYYFVLNRFGPAFEYMQKARYFFEQKELTITLTRNGMPVAWPNVITGLENMNKPSGITRKPLPFRHTGKRSFIFPV
ncbi:hypothetical protein [Paraflavitalea speifideaquila]|uniref:hypothetical protein n=1 Tax=Paraflavitalea speifideaquila TaxID=3076558 RepID=UPI0028EC1F3A|nr:hypothetical protein [Paraflavitalea speifideiaquila]